MQLRSESKVFIDTGNKYIECKQQMDALYDKLDEYHKIAKYPVMTDSHGIIIEKDDDIDDDDGPLVVEFKQEYQQQTVDGTPVRTLKELYQAAEVALPHFQDIVKDLKQRVCKNSGNEDARIHFAPLKGKLRAEAKARDDYDDRKPGPGISWLYDIVRGSIEFTDKEQIAECLDLLHSHPSLHIVKAVNRFASPTLTGYRDLKFCIQIECPTGSREGFKHICEIQIHHRDIKKLDTDLGSHAYYEFFRRFFAGATESLKDRLDDLKFICSGGTLGALLENAMVRDEKRLVRVAGLLDEHLCEWELALRGYIKLANLRRDKYGEDHELVADAYSAKANVLLKQGNMKEAAMAFAVSLQIYKKALGDQHTKVADSYEAMANIQLTKKVANKTRLSYLCKALEIRKKVNGATDLSVARIYHQMACIQSDDEEALQLLRNALAIFENAFGEDHLSVAEVYDEMAAIWSRRDEEDERKACEQKAAGIRKSIAKAMVDSDLSSDIEAIPDMASKLFDQGHYDEALQCYKKMEDSIKKTFGEDHMSLVAPYKGIAEVLKSKGDLPGALDYFLKELTVKKKALGDDDPSLREAFISLAAMAEDQSDYQKAADLYFEYGHLNAAFRCYTMLSNHQVDIHGAKHHSLVKTYERMAEISLAQLDTSTAISNFEKVLIIQMHNQDGNYSAAKNIADVLCKEQKYDDALLKYHQLVVFQQRVHGDCHSSVADTYILMGNVCREQENLDNALRYYELALDIMNAAGEEEHSVIAGIYHSMASTLQDHGNLDDAMDYHNQACNVYEKSLGENTINVAGQSESLAFELMKKGRVDDALVFFGKFINAKRKARQEDVSLAKSLIAMSNMLLEESREDEALTMFGPAMEIYENNVTHMSGRSTIAAVADMYNGMAGKLDGKRGYIDECTECHRKGFVFYQKAKMSSRATAAHDEMADKIVYKQKMLATTLDGLQATLIFHIKNLGDQHPNVGHCYQELAHVFLQLGRQEEASEMIERCKKLSQKQEDRVLVLAELERMLLHHIGATGDGDPEVVSVYNALTYVLDELGRHEEAAAMEKDASALAQTQEGQKELLVQYQALQKKLAFYVETFGEAHMHVGEVYDELSTILSLLGRSKEACEMKDWADAIIGTAQHDLGME